MIVFVDKDITASEVDVAIAGADTMDVLCNGSSWCEPLWRSGALHFGGKELTEREISASGTTEWRFKDGRKT